MERESQKARKTVLPMQRVKVAEPDSDGRRRFEGYAAVFGNRDHHGDIIVKGAFERTLAERPDVKILWQHDTKQPIGKMEAGYENDHGLLVRGVLSDIPLVKDTVVPLLMDGVVNGLSIGYDVLVEEHNVALEAWLLKEIELHEFSPVTFPANELATVSAVKSLEENVRQDAHSDLVHRHTKTMLHELTGYYGTDPTRREGLDFERLKQLRDSIEGILPEEHRLGQSAADVDLEIAFLEGALSVVEAGKD